MVRGRRSIPDKLSADGPFETPRIRLPRRSMGVFLCLASSLGVLAIVMGVRIMSMDSPNRKSGAELLVFMGITITLAFLLPGLYLVTRFRKTLIEGRDVLFRKGWLLGSSVLRRRLSEYLGLHQHLGLYSTIGVMDIVTVGAAPGGKIVDVQILTLKHGTDKSLDVMLACNGDGDRVGRLMVHLAERFSLDILDPGLGGFTVRGSDRTAAVGDSVEIPAIDSGTAVRRADTPERFSISNLPHGMEVVEAENGVVRILLPDLPVPAVVMIMLGSLVAFIGAGGVFAGLRDGESTGFFILQSALLAVGAVLIGLDVRTNLKGGRIAPGHRRRRRITLGRDEITYRPCPHAEVVRIRWDSLQNVVVAGNGKSKGVSLVTSSGNHDMAAGSSMDVLTCLRRIIIDKAAERNGTRKGPCDEQSPRRET